jgi:acetate---CoA ligase (ADP-forming)
MNTLLEPKSIAIIGASSTPGKVGHDICKNLLTQGYQGSVYPINPKGGEILGCAAYATINDVPAVVDLAIIVIPALYVPEAVEQCVAKNIPTIMVISAGFSEIHTEQGKALEEKILF